MTPEELKRQVEVLSILLAGREEEAKLRESVAFNAGLEECERIADELIEAKLEVARCIASNGGNPEAAAKFREAQICQEMRNTISSRARLSQKEET